MQLTKTTLILIIEDNDADAKYVQELLPADLYAFEHKRTLKDALACNESDYDLIFLDLSLPDGYGLETFITLNKTIKKKPIVVLTGLDDEELASQAVQQGAQDYILKKDMTEYSLTRTIKYAVERKAFETNARRLAVLEEHDEFMAMLSHDLKNPVVAANRVLKMMAEGVTGEINNEQAELFKHLIASNETLLLLINNLIEAYRYENNAYIQRLEQVDLRDVVRACVDTMTPIARTRAINLDMSQVDEVPPLKADSISVRRMVQNLLDNAIKFSPNQSNVIIQLTEADNHLRLTVSDFGPGISDSERVHLFQRFKRGAVGLKHSSGTGLGLFLCKRIVDAHNGHINIISEEGKGAVFEVNLPIATYAQTAPVCLS